MSFDSKALVPFYSIFKNRSKNGIEGQMHRQQMPSMKDAILNCELCIMNYALFCASCVLRIWHLIRQNESVEDFACLFINSRYRQKP